MNEEKRNYNNFMNCGAMDKKEEAAASLVAQISYFISHNKITPKEYIFLSNILKQLSQRRNSFPRKVLRGMQNKFELIQNQYNKNR